MVRRSVSAFVAMTSALAMTAIAHTAQAASNPPPVTQLRVYDAGGTAVNPVWQNPSGIEGVVASYEKGSHAPSTPQDGTEVTTDKQSATIRHLARNTRYSLAVWTYNAAHRYTRTTTSFVTLAKPPAKGALAGTVTDAAGSPLAHVLVWAAPAALKDRWQVQHVFGPIASTDAEGHFTLHLEPGRYVLSYDGAHGTGGRDDNGGYQAGNPVDTFVVTSGQTTTGATTKLVDGAAVHGTVTDTSGHPLQGVVITTALPPPYLGEYYSTPVYSPLEPSINRVRSAADGSFTVTGITPGAVQIWCDASHYAVTGGSDDNSGYSGFTDATVFAQARRTATVPTQQLAVLTYRGRRYGALTGIVTDTAHHRLKNVEVTLQGWHTWTTADGRYVLHLPAGNYHPCIETTFVTEHRPVGGFAPGCGQWTKVTAGASSTRNITAQQGGRIEGLVTGAADGPIHDVVVRAAGYHQSYGITGVDGRYSIDNLDTNSYFVDWDTSAASGPHNGSGVVAARRRSDDFRYVQTGRTLLLDRTMPRGGAVKGRVAGDQPLGGITVDVSSSRVTTDQHGRYVAHGVPRTGKYKVCFSSNQQDVWGNYIGKWITHCDRSVTVRVGHTHTGVDTSLRPISTGVSVHVTDAAGDPVAGSDVLLLWPCTGDCEDYPGFTGGQIAMGPSRYTGANGTVTDALQPGDWAICLRNQYAHASSNDSPTGYADKCVDPAAFSTHVTTGQTTRVDVQLAPN
jgi:hypothetical protein